MATSDAAQLAGIADQVGMIEKGKKADLLVLQETAGDAYDALLHASAEDVALVIVGGVPVYGERAMVNRVASNKQWDPVGVCGTEKVVASFGRWTQTVEELRRALGRWGQVLSPVAACNQ
jgi:hypothetical protein